MKNIFITSDHHYSHFNIIHFCGRPFKTVHEMNKVMTERWNSVVQPGDTVYHLGDLCFHNKIDPKELVSMLNGTITLIRGNHDKQKTLQAVDKWYQSFPIIIEEFSCIMNHRPIYPKGTPDPFNDHDKTIDPDAYDFFLTGHIHEKRRWTGRSLNVGIDQHNFYPLHIDKIYEMLLERKKEMENGIL